MYFCEAGECEKMVNESGCFRLSDGSHVVLCKEHEEEARRDGEVLVSAAL